MDISYYRKYIIMMRCIVDPRGMQIASNVMDQHDGSLRVEFVPATVGELFTFIRNCFFRKFTLMKCRPAMSLAVNG